MQPQTRWSRCSASLPESLGAALFAAEVLYSEPEFEYLVLLPGLISAIVGYSIYSMFAGWGVLFEVPDLTFHDPRQLVVCILLGVVCELPGFVYPRIFHGVRDRILRPLPIPAWLKPAVGALVLGGLALVGPADRGPATGERSRHQKAWSHGIDNRIAELMSPTML